VDENGVTAYIDKSTDYDLECPARLCCVFEFPTCSEQIGARGVGEHLTVSLGNLPNPESVAPLEAFRVRTMMNYQGDLDGLEDDGFGPAGKYYVIDVSEFIETGYFATAGEITYIAGDMPVEELGSYATFLSNQAYRVAFTPPHSAYQFGHIKLTIPPDFKFSSESTAAA